MAKKDYGTRKKYHYIYKTTNLLSGRYYIGMHSTDDLNDGYLGSGTLLRRSINKYGKENHSIEILEYYNSREELAAREKEVVNLQEIAKEECMNLKVGGFGGFTDEILRLGRAAAVEKRKKDLENPEWLSMFGKKVSNGLRKSYQNGRVPLYVGKGFFGGKTHKPETIEKMKEIKRDYGRGETNSQFGTCWITNEVENKKIKKDTPIPEGWRLGRKLG